MQKINDTFTNNLKKKMKKNEVIMLAEIVTGFDNIEVINIEDKGGYLELKYKGFGNEVNRFIISETGKSVYFGHWSFEDKALNQFGHQKAIEYLQSKYSNLLKAVSTLD